MSNEKVVVKQGGIGFAGLLCIVFVTLKLAGVTEVATWSWWWVLAPIWLPASIVLSAIVAIAVVTFIGLIIAEFLRRR